MNETTRPHNVPLLAGVESRPGLLRALGPGMAIALVVGNVIGSGIFLKPGTIAAAAGDFSLILTAWVVGGFVCILGGLCFAELAAMLPRAGGLYVYLREAYGRPVAFLFGWMEFLFGKPASCGALSVAFIGALGEAAGQKFGLLSTAVLAAALLGLLAWVNIIGVIWGGRVQAGTTIIKAGFLVTLAALPFVLLALGSGGFDAANYQSGLTRARADTQPTTAASFAAAMLAVMWAYNGWHGVTPVAEEIRNPSRNLPLALFAGIGVLIVLYVAVNLAYHGVLSMDEMADAGDHAPQGMIKKLLAPWGTRAADLGIAAMSAVVMCSVFGAINSNLLGAPRVTFAMGRDGVFFKRLGRVHVNFRTPAAAIAVLAIMSAALVIGAAVVLQGDPERFHGKTTVFKMLTDFVVFSASLFYVMAVLAVIVLRRRHPDWKRPYRTLGYPLVPLAYVVFYAWFLYMVYTGGDDSRFSANVGLVLVGLGLPVYFAWQRWARRGSHE